MNKRIIIVWCLIGFMVGIIIGFLFLKAYITDYTNKCIDSYNNCRNRYNSEFFYNEPIQDVFADNITINMTFSDVGDKKDESFGGLNTIEENIVVIIPTLVK